MSIVALFTRSAEAFVDTVRRIPEEAWDAPGLGEWTVRSLVGHTTRAILTVEQYLHLDDPDDVTVPTAEYYYARVYAQFTDPVAVAARGVEAGVWLGEDPLHKIEDALARASLEIELAPEGRIVSIGGMGIPLGEYLRTRVFELVVHTIDIAHAVHIEHRVPVEAIAESARLAVSTAIERDDAEPVLLALTGRAALPEAYSMV